MPSMLAEGRDYTSFDHSPSTFAEDLRDSLEKPYHPSRAPSDRMSNGDLSVKSGNLSNGHPAMHALPNGQLHDSRNKDFNATTLNKRGSGTENEKRPLNGGTLWPKSGRRDDGAFAVIESEDPDDSHFGSTQVKMEHIPNGLDGTQESELSESPTGLRPSMDFGQHPHRTPSSYPPTQLNGESKLQTPNGSTQRVSSPPSFPPLHPTPTATSSIQPPIGARLQHRHTLEVPKVTTSRLSRDFPSTNSEDVATASGRFSPTTPTRRRGSTTIARRGTRSIQSDTHIDVLQQDEDAARWADHVRQKRASKRKRKEDEEDDRVVVGTKVDQNHVNYVTAYNMLTGIRFTVSRTNAKMIRELNEADFETKHKFSFDITGNELTPSARYDFKFKDYAPWVFRHLRQIFQQDPADYLMSLTSKYILSELGSPGKSGSFFYFSRDYKYIIKTIHHAEHKFLRKMLRDYYKHVCDNPNTLLSQFYGLHRVKMPYGRKIHFVVMNNLFPPHRDIHHTFDLKGSTIGRDFKEEDLEKNPRATLKDLNWLRRDLHLEFGPTKKAAFIAQMEQDVKLLQRLKIMDYSLLIGIHDLQKGNEENLREKTLQVFSPGGEAEEVQPNMLMRTPSKLENARKAKELRAMVKLQKPVPMGQTTSKMPEDVVEAKKNSYFYSDDGGFSATHEDDRPGEEIYYLGIIDCLTHYSLIKRAEHFFKGLANQESQISAIPPERYGDRFVKFISGVTKTKEAAEREKFEERLAGQDDSPQSLEEHRRTPTEVVMEKAEKVAERSRRHGRSEEDVPDRSITVVRSPSAERGEIGHTLPVVEEALECSSTGGRSGRSQRSVRSIEQNPQSSSNLLSPGTTQSHAEHVRPPPTPPKDGREWNEQDYRPPTPPKDGPPTPPKEEKEKFRGRGKEKDLPIIPRIHSGELQPPMITQEYSRSPSRVKAGGVGMEEYGVRVRTVN